MSAATEPAKTGWQFVVVVLIYFVSSFVHAPVADPPKNPLPHFSLGYFYFAPPMVLTGDSPHYLVIVNSLIEDFDLDVSNNYRQAEAGDFDQGVKNRGVHLDWHSEPYRGSLQCSWHNPYMPALVAAFAWPFRGTPWVEPVAIWLTMLAGLTAIWFLWRLTDGYWYLLLALATPLWCYSRDLWTEPWTAACWTALLFFGRPRAVGLAAFLGVLTRYPFASVVVVAGVVLLWRGERKRSIAILAGCGLALALGLAIAEYSYGYPGHFTPFHGGRPTRFPGAGNQSSLWIPFSLQWQGLAGLLFDPEVGLLVFSPFLIWGIWRFRKGGYRYLPAVAYFLLIASYADWPGGASFSARYLVPMLPVAVLGVSEEKPRGRIFAVLVAWSLLWAAIGGLASALVYDRSPLGAVQHVIEKLSALD